MLATYWDMMGFTIECCSVWRLELLHWFTQALTILVFGLNEVLYGKPFCSIIYVILPIFLLVTLQSCHCIRLTPLLCPTSPSLVYLHVHH